MPLTFFLALAMWLGGYRRIVTHLGENEITLPRYRKGMNLKQTTRMGMEMGHECSYLSL